MAIQNTSPQSIINSVAPIRICDNGGWTDTWFAEHGQIFNIGVYPCVEVQLAVYQAERREHRIVINAENYGEKYALPSDVRMANRRWIRHPLLEAAIEYMRVPDELAIEATIYSQAPAGASTGTSAAVSVALLGALDQLTPGRKTPYEIAMAAHQVETEILHQQSGIQDQLASAFGNINFIEMQHYPHASVTQVEVPDAVWWELERRLALIFLGKTHHSSQVHEMVIASLEQHGPDNPVLESLRQTAVQSRDALYNADFNSLGAAMIANTEAQGRLHPALINSDAHQVIEIARQYRAVGWKVNGAGGEGGSLTILCDEHSQARRAMIAAIEAENSLCRNIPISLSRSGLRVWQQVIAGPPAR